MTRPPDESNEIEEFLRRAEREFGRRPDLPDEPPSPPPRPSPPRPFVTQSLLWAIGVIYVLSCVLSGSLFQPDFPVLMVLGAKVNERIANGEMWRLLTAVFLHANLIHVFFNGYALSVLGPETERFYGHARFLALYLLSGLGGSIASYALSPAPAVGASGAIFGLIGGLGIFYYLNRQALGEFGRNQVRSIAAIAFINLLIGFAAQGVIDNWGHLGGLLSGLIIGIALSPRLTIDLRFFPPILIRHFPAQSWLWMLAIALVMIVLVRLITPA
ncbi:MAG: rhomboid family intramembrane serine protease [Chloroflexus sp.]|jgi:rhomboid protease GluP|uniref:rhomboid family intramembrane serine protease n=1 Tax=Chloroflexus sp. Y-396-1 TaxID=867845 RepID=UPI00048CCE3D|nr:rhomboid family intramembrane serine protease [Chloroflexus sp. Y-396-1]MBO9319405.1 rhomboid family intramembrane serine protease [Chloroflexus sp.]